MRRRPCAVLDRALLRSADAAGAAIAIMDAATCDWASATFVGARHRLRLDAAPSPELDAWLAALPDHDLRVPGQLVADLSVERDDAGQVVVEVLTIMTDTTVDIT